MLDVLPRFSEVTNSALSKQDLVLSEFTVLTKSIDADNKLNLLCLERLGLDIFPLAVS